MTQNIYKKTIIKITSIHCKIGLKMQYYSNQTAKIVGQKTLNNNSTIYLIELFNYNRVWILHQEFKTLEKPFDKF